MRILVTGGEGYIGTALVPRLVGAGHSVTSLDAGLFEGCAFLDRTPAAELWRLDVRDVQVGDLQGFDAIVHLAGLSNDPLGAFKPEITDEINHRASVRLATLAREAGVGRFLFASSCSNYGAAGDVFRDETAELLPQTAYAKSKVDAEIGLQRLATKDFSPVYIRASTAYGVSPMLRFDLVLNNLVAWATATGRVQMKSDGTPWRPIVHIEDISAAYEAALLAPRDVVHNRAFNVGQTTENYRIAEIAGLVEDAVHGSEITMAAGAGPDTRCYRVDCGRIARELHEFKPQWTAARGAAQLAEAMRAANLTIEDVEGARYSRIASLERRVGSGELTESLRWTDSGLKRA